MNIAKNAFRFCILLLLLSIPRSGVSQFVEPDWPATDRVLDVKLFNENPGRKYQEIINLISEHVEIRIVSEFSLDGLGDVKLDVPVGNVTVRRLLKCIDQLPGYKTLIREREVLLVGDIEESRLKYLQGMVRNFNHLSHDDALEEIMKSPHPDIYPCLFWAMKYDRIDKAVAICKGLIRRHSQTMYFAPSFEHAKDGFNRVLESSEWNSVRKGFGCRHEFVIDYYPVEAL